MIKALQPQHLQGMHPAPCVVGTVHCRTLELYSYATHYFDCVKNIDLAAGFNQPELRSWHECLGGAKDRCRILTEGMACFERIPVESSAPSIAALR
jgi:hypothetical protein